MNWISYDHEICTILQYLLRRELGHQSTHSTGHCWRSDLYFQRALIWEVRMDVDKDAAPAKTPMIYICGECHRCVFHNVCSMHTTKWQNSSKQRERDSTKGRDPVQRVWLQVQHPTTLRRYNWSKCSGSCTRRGQRGWLCLMPDKWSALFTWNSNPHFFVPQFFLNFRGLGALHAPLCASFRSQSQYVDCSANEREGHDWMAARVVLHLCSHSLP